MSQEIPHYVIGPILNYSLTSSFLDSNILLSTLLPNTLLYVIPSR